MSVARGSLFIVSAPSGAGKSTLVERLVQTFPDLAFSVSYTTRPPRGAERDGVDYHFVDEARFAALRDGGAFLEWAEVHGRGYATGRAETEALLAAGRDVLLDIDVQGAAQVRGSAIPVVSVFVLPPSRDELEARLRRRGTDSDAVIERRLQGARGEIARAAEYDYILVNDDLEAAAGELVAIVRAARARTARRAARLAAIGASFGLGGA